MANRISPTADDLLVFVDDTGHEELPLGHDVYGLGGCAVLGAEYGSLITQPWKQIRKAVTGSELQPLHAYDFSAQADPNHITLVANFFRTMPFMRFAAVATRKTGLPPDMALMYAVAENLKGCILDVANSTSFARVFLMFEESQRANEKIAQHFSRLDILHGDTPIPVEHCFLGKQYNEPGMEVADFVMHSVGRQARRVISGKSGFEKDFDAVFGVVEDRLLSFVQLTEIIRSQPTSFAVGLRLGHQYEY